ncbi:hypothetical protein J3Q64DRAFT_1777936 [Phycomyces blakesleeanus]|uniref:Transcription activator GCR1-like domain-containing protein n=1 Tax=Phycomyces blakesleeanus TaxID=4837 RepID=A0ABR3AJS1_PHYBL
MDLYGDQRSTMLGVTLQDPRGPRLKAFLREIRRQDARQSRQARQARQARAQQKQQQQQQQFENENEIDVYNLKRVLTHLLQKMDGIVESMNINNNTQVAQPQPRLQPHQECYCQSEDIKSIKKSLEQINTTFDHLRRACAMFAYGMNPPPLNSCTTGAAPTPDPAMNNTGAQQNTTFDSLLTHPSYKPTPHTQSIQPMPTERTARNVRPTPLTQLKKSASPVPIHPIPFDVLSHNISHYTMQRWINNVKDLWCEYSTGIKMGGLQYPSIQEIEKKYKSGWRSETGKYAVIFKVFKCVFMLIGFIYIQRESSFCVGLV